MSRLYNDPARFAEEAAEGFVSAHRQWVRAVPGGVIRRAATPSGQVAVVVGGGSGHYPAFAGLVGEGLAAGAVLGNVFASPSTAQVVSVARAAENGGGVLLTYGNYAGDVLNFAAAQERLRGDGIACETVRVTDDISSAPSAESHRRRGVAGDLMVFKVAAAAAAEGRPLGEVAELAAAANERTRTLGVAFSGCTLPGADHPLFTVPAGRMAIGLGIHGEPGLVETEMPSADDLAALFVSRLLAELPAVIPSPTGQRVVALLNGLGSVKYEELFVVYRAVQAGLQAAGLTVVDCEGGGGLYEFRHGRGLVNAAVAGRRPGTVVGCPGRCTGLPPRTCPCRCQRCRYSRVRGFDGAQSHRRRICRRDTHPDGE
jgi:dihydroxyacetone kinase